MLDTWLKQWFSDSHPATKMLTVISFSCRSHVSFGLDGPHQMQEQAHLQVVAKNLYTQDSQRTPVPYGVLDRKMVDS